jgi:hypothetical protein
MHIVKLVLFLLTGILNNPVYAGNFFEDAFSTVNNVVNGTARNAVDCIKYPRECVENKINKVGTAGSKLIQDPIGYLTTLPTSILVDVCSAPVQQYEQGLQQQVNQWKELSNEFILASQHFYSVDLTTIKIAENISTSNGAAQTFGNKIYFPRAINLTDWNDIWLMLHELEHTVQYSRSEYGQAGKICEYEAKSIGSGFEHDAIDMEKAADNKANFAVNEVYQAINKGTAQLDNQTLNQIPTNQVLIVNETSFMITWVMETSSIQPTRLFLAPNSWRTYTGNPTDSGFEVEINTVNSGNVHWIRRALNGGTEQHIKINQQNLLDFFQTN